LVWSVVVDFDNYRLWNRFCPKISGELELGSPIAMRVDLGNGLQDQVEYVSRIEPPNVIVWSMENRPGDPIHADRLQRITAIDESRCSYWTVDYFSGDMIGLMIKEMGEAVERGFNICAKGLKARAEALHSNSMNPRSIR
jgi:hypothetical protein